MVLKWALNPFINNELKSVVALQTNDITMLFLVPAIGYLVKVVHNIKVLNIIKAPSTSIEDSLKYTFGRNIFESFIGVVPNNYSEADIINTLDVDATYTVNKIFMLRIECKL